MAKKNLLKPKKNPLFVVFYIIAATALTGCLGYLVYQSRERAKAYEETIARLAASETEYVSERQMEETEQEETQSQSANVGVITEPDLHAGTEAESTGEGAEDQTNSPAAAGLSDLKETNGSTDSLGQNQVTNVKDLQILVLNGTETSGVAAYWKNRLEQQGYTHVAAASYKQLAEKTTIYTDRALGAEELKKLFPNAVLQPGAAQGEYEIAEGSTQPESVDVYVIIGSSDAQNQ